MHCIETHHLLLVTDVTKEVLEPSWNDTTQFLSECIGFFRRTFQYRGGQSYHVHYTQASHTCVQVRMYYHKTIYVRMCTSIFTNKNINKTYGLPIIVNVFPDPV